MKRSGFKPRAPQREASAIYQQWEAIQVDPDTGEIMGGCRDE